MARFFGRGDDKGDDQEWAGLHVEDDSSLRFDRRPSGAHFRPSEEAPSPDDAWRSLDINADPATSAASTNTIVDAALDEPDWDRWESEAGFDSDRKLQHPSIRPFEGDPPSPADLIPGTTHQEPSSSWRLLGDMLVERGHIQPEQLVECLSRQPSAGLRLGEILLSMNAVEERQLTRALADQFGVGMIDLSRNAPIRSLSSRLSEEAARKYCALPLRDVDGVIDVIVGDLRPGIDTVLSEAIGGPVQVLAVPPSAARQAIDRSYQALGDVERLVRAYTADRGTPLGQCQGQRGGHYGRLARGQGGIHACDPGPAGPGL